LVLNQIGRRLTETMHLGAGEPDSRRLLVLLDEFPSLGRLDFFETALAFLAGYGVKCLLIAQSLNQLEKAYGHQNAILDNCHVRLTYAANDDHTAGRISDLLGQGTEVKRQLNFSGARLSPWLGSVSENEQEYGRVLLTPGEVLQLPYDDALVLVGALPPYRGKKVMHYQDDRFKARAGLPPPDSAKEQTAELLPMPASAWAGLLAAPPPEPVKPVVEAPAQPAQPPAEPALSHAKVDGRNPGTESAAVPADWAHFFPSTTAGAGSSPEGDGRS
jgi:type IV secretion system protein VirD4